MKNLNSLILEIINGSMLDSNTFKSKKHEDKFEFFLRNNGYSKILKKDNLYDIIRNTNSLTNLPSLSGKYLFISQPFGSQRYPDFIVVVDGYVVWFELKRSKTDKITWNTGYPRHNIIYIFDSEKIGRVTFLGQHHPKHGNKEEENKEFDSLMKEHAELLSKSDPKYSHLVGTYYCRSMFGDMKESYNKSLLSESLINHIKKITE